MMKKIKLEKVESALPILIFVFLLLIFMITTGGAIFDGSNMLVHRKTDPLIQSSRLWECCSLQRWELPISRRGLW